jgi:hypothetical protein
MEKFFSTGPWFKMSKRFYPNFKENFFFKIPSFWSENLGAESFGQSGIFSTYTKLFIIVEKSLVDAKVRY